MRSEKIIIDTGPIVAFLNRNDRYHEWAKNQFSLARPPFITCESVISEACFLLRHYSNGPQNVLALVEREIIILPFNLQSESKSLQQLLSKYHNIPMSLADACLVRIAEQVPESLVLTLDSDFNIYRMNKRKVIPTIMPDSNTDFHER